MNRAITLEFILVAFLLFTEDLKAFQQQKAPDNWFNLDSNTSSIFGVGTERAYEEFLKGKKSRTVIVAIIDGGVDYEHEDLKEVMWINEREIPGNGIDDDKNGYVDDIYGWNFIGGNNGDNVNHDTFELTRLFKIYHERFKNTAREKLSKAEQVDFDFYVKIRAEFEEKADEAEQQYALYGNFLNQYKWAYRLMQAYIDKEELRINELEKIESSDEKIANAQGLLMYTLSNNITEKRIVDIIEYYKNQVDYGYNVDFDPRAVVGDNWNNPRERYYGNGDVKGPDASHGTHVAGIVSAQRKNGKGIDGIADNVKIMALRAVPNGDERDKDIANAIYYAVDNGAKVINMSFGKKYSPDKAIVDEAVRYAEAKGVLFVHAAGNNSENNDQIDHFPTRTFLNKKIAQNWIEVGASSWKKGEELPASFTNYGKKSVDVFAPGVDINSTTPDQGYEPNSGTSMASPVTAGVAALLFSYYPELTSKDVKDIILKSVTPLKDLVVNLPGEEEKTVKFGELSITGGVVNAYEAVKMAENFKKLPKK